MNARADENPWIARRYLRASAGADDAGIEVERLFLGSKARLGKYLVQLVGDRSLAEDLLQDTFHDAFRARDQLDDLRSAEAWLFAIARHRALAALRRRRRLGNAFGRLVREPHGHESDQELLVLRDLLERHLTPDERSLLLLRYLHGFGAHELAEIAGCSPEAVRQRLSRARAKLLEAAAPGGRTTSGGS
jgi:RNA polymerase sigma-70 factor (ECF subfamily)